MTKPLIRKKNPKLPDLAENKSQRQSFIKQKIANLRESQFGKKISVAEVKELREKGAKWEEGKRVLADQPNPEEKKLEPNNQSQIDPASGREFIINNSGEKQFLDSGQVSPLSSEDLLTAAGLFTGGGALLGLGKALSKTAAQKSGTAVITRSATLFNKAGTTLTTQRAFVGKPITQGVNKLFHTVKPIATRFATNQKSIGLTQGMLSKITQSAGGVMALIGTYPFAGFIKEESLQTLSFGVKSAMENGDLEGAESALQQQEELLDPSTWERIIDNVPFANVMNQIKNFYEAARKKTEIDRRNLEKMKGGQENG